MAILQPLVSIFSTGTYLILFLLQTNIDDEEGEKSRTRRDEGIESSLLFKVSCIDRLSGMSQPMHRPSLTPSTTKTYLKIAALG